MIFKKDACHLKQHLFYFILLGFSFLALSNITVIFFLNQKARFTNAISAGTSTKGPITPANA